MAIKILFAALLLTFSSCHNQKTSTNNKKNIEDSSKGKDWYIYSTNEWLISEGLVNVESIIYDKANQVYYASNGKGYELGTSGFLSRISKSGSLKELKWVENLNRPTGMAIYDSLLYVADVNSLLAIDIRSGKILGKYLEPIPNSGLNDVAVNQQGEVYVSASFKHSIFKLDDGKLSMWSQDEEKLKWANGILCENNQIVMAGLNLCRIDTKSKEISVVNLSGRIKDFDGIVSDKEGGYFLTTVEHSGLFHIDGKQNITKLKENTHYFGDLDFIPEVKQLVVARGNKKDEKFYISVFKMEKNLNKKKN